MKLIPLPNMLRVVFLFFLPLGVIAAALPRLIEGIALERAFPDSALVMTNVGLPAASYLHLEKTLSSLPASDGETRILAAEAAVDAGRPPVSVLPAVEDGLSRAPADARGWILLASMVKDQDPQRAAKAFNLAFELAPLDHYLIVPRTALGAQLWDHLPTGERHTILSDARAIATNDNRRDDLRALLGTPAGAALVTKAFENDPEGIKKLNRDLTREALHLR